MSRWQALLPVAVLVALVVMFAGWSLHRQSQVTPTAMIGKPLPALNLPRLLGAGGGPAPTRGPMLVNVFASWCAPCAEEAPALMALRLEGVTVVGVAYKDKTADARAFLQRLGDPYATVLVDADGAAGLELGVTGAPETFAIDRHGVIRGKFSGPLSAAEAETLLSRAAG